MKYNREVITDGGSKKIYSEFFVTPEYAEYKETKNDIDVYVVIQDIDKSTGKIIYPNFYCYHVPKDLIFGLSENIRNNEKSDEEFEKLMYLKIKRHYASRFLNLDAVYFDTLNFLLVGEKVQDEIKKVKDSLFGIMSIINISDPSQSWVSLIPKEIILKYRNVS